MVRGSWDSANNVLHIVRCKAARLGDGFAKGELCHSRATRDGRHAAFRLETNLLDASALDSYAEPNHIAADGVLCFRRSVCAGKVPSVSRILKVIE